MDLGTVLEKLQTNVYENAWQVHQDVKLVRG